MKLNAHKFLENLPFPFAYHELVTDDEGHPVDYRHVFVNHMWEILTGITRDRVLGKLASGSIPDSEKLLGERLEIYGRVAKTGEHSSFETYSPFTSKWYEVHVSSTEQGFFATTFNDISALRESERMLKQAQEIAHLGSWELDLTKNELTWSDEVYRIFGLKPQEFGATYEAFLDYVHQEDRAAVDAAYSGSLRDGKDSYEIEHRVVRKNTGEIRWVEEKCQHMRNSDGKIIRSVGMVLDITERRLEKERLASTAEKLASSNKELEQFAYLASHDLQEPLRMVSSFSGLLLANYRGKLDEKADQYLDFMIEGAQRMQALVSDLLLYSRLTGQGEELVPTSAQAALDLALTYLHSAIAESGAKVTQDPMPYVIADPLHLTQVFQNLVGNALKFRRTDIVPEIHVGVQEFAGSGLSETDLQLLKPNASAFWCFSVRDNGIGIDPRYSNKIFQIFQRLDRSGKYPGTGIGLALCKKIVERHGGRIWFTSGLGKGTTFFFTLPAVPEEPTSIVTSSRDARM